LRRPWPTMADVWTASSNGRFDVSSTAEAWLIDRHPTWHTTRFAPFRPGIYFIEDGGPDDIVGRTRRTAARVRYPKRRGRIPRRRRHGAVEGPLGLDSP
jgi:hypothetical protein